MNPIAPVNLTLPFEDSATDVALERFHPLIQRWFTGRFAGPTEPQRAGWPRILEGSHTLIAAPTGSGKTLTAFLASIDRLLRLSLDGKIGEEVRVLYVSPLRALSNDMHRNLEVPLAEIQALAQEAGFNFPPIRAGLRTGDTSPSARQAIVKHPPHILVTTPESLYLMLTGSKSREILKTVDTVIVDEIHALVRDKRGSHLSLTLERLEGVAEQPIQRIGLSATQRPIELTANFLVGAREENGDCAIVDVGHGRHIDVAITTPDSELQAVCSHEQWAEINKQIVQMVEEHRSTLIFVNTRRLAERLTHQLSELLGQDAISSHHGSLSAPLRQDTEQRLKNGQLKAVVATSSLELGLDVGYIDLVVQIGSPRSIAAFLQRVGRSGHALGLTPKGRIFALTRDEALECMALVRAIRNRHLDTVVMPVAPLDVLAQQIVAEVARQEWGTDELFAMVRRAAPYANLPRSEFDRILQMLSEGMARATGRSRVFLHHDHVNKRVRARKGAAITAASNGGAIPEVASYRVVAEPDRVVVGSVDEDFAVESMAGDVFLLGNTSWRVLNIRGGDVNVVDAGGAAPTIPFWIAEAPGRTYELSEEVSDLRAELDTRVSDLEAATQWLIEETAVSQQVAEQIATYALAQKEAIGLLPTSKRIVFERFFDESGGMQLVIHAPFGSRITRAWGLAMRKRFCRSFDFELQATADDDGIMLSLGPQHSFPLESMFAMLNPQNVKGLLEQAVLAMPMFLTRWRWNVIRALLVNRQNNGRKVPPPLQRFRSDDLLTACFPAITGCKEEIIGDIPIPDQPLVRQTMEDCFTEAMDFPRLQEILGRVERGEIEFLARDTREPSPFAYELLNANPYAFLDGGELQERRARAVSTRRSLTVESVSDLGHLDPLAIEQVVRDAQPYLRDGDELHDALLTRFVIPDAELLPYGVWLNELLATRRATRVVLGEGVTGWVAAERLPWVQAAYPEARLEPVIDIPDSIPRDQDQLQARLAIIRGWMELIGPIRASALAFRLAITVPQAEACLEALEGEGVILRGRFTPESFPQQGWKEGDPEPVEKPELEWCHRRLLARIHRLTMEGLRRQIQPVTVDIYQRFLLQHHGVVEGHHKTGENGLFEALSQLQGWDIPAVSWERDLLPARVENYQPKLLDDLCFEGTVSWGRLYPPRRNPERSRPMASLTRIVPLSLFLRSDLPWLTSRAPQPEEQTLSGVGQEVLQVLRTQGAMFSEDLCAAAGILAPQLDDALGELISQGFVNADGFGGLRQLIEKRSENGRRDHVGRRLFGLTRTRKVNGKTGRWSVWRRGAPEGELTDWSIIEAWAWQLLRRWGVVFRDLLSRESGAPKWYELLQVYRRLEAGGEIRGGRFITGVGGEQYALGETVRHLRALRETPAENEIVVLCGADPLNLAGIITPHPRLPATASNRIAYLNGQPAAYLQGGEIQWLASPTDDQRLRIQGLLEGWREVSLDTTTLPSDLS
ncbi:MAG: DEAD/DEAH box helicase [Planctomycetales bacterium]